jgi:hypothetical protein
MSVVLTRREYSAAASYAGSWLKEERPKLLPLSAFAGEACGVYILCGRDPVNRRPVVMYIGKADRRMSGGDVSARWQDHLKSEKAQVVRGAAVIPLAADTPPAEVTQIEGDVARYFGVPRLCRAVPRKRASTESTESPGVLSSDTSV